MPNAPFLAPERDGAFKVGRPKASGGTIYNSLPGVASISTTSAAQTINVDVYAPLFVETPIIVDQLVAEVATSGGAGNFRMGLYNADTDWQPYSGQAPLADSGSTSAATTGVKTYTPGTPLFLPRGRYLTVFAVDNATPTYTIVRGACQGAAALDTLGGNVFVGKLNIGRTYAAFPTPGTKWDGVSSSSVGLLYYVFLRVSQP